MKSIPLLMTSSANASASPEVKSWTKGGPVRTLLGWFTCGAVVALILASCGAGRSGAIGGGSAQGHANGRGTTSSSGSSAQPDSAIITSDGSVIWVRSQQDHVYRSTDGGSSFTEVTPPSWPGAGAAASQSCGLGEPPQATASEMWIAQGTCGGGVLVAVTTNGGTSWTTSSLPEQYNPQENPSASTSFIGSADGWVSVLSGHVGVSETTDVFRSVDGGMTWTHEATVPEAGPAHFVTSSLGFADPAGSLNEIQRSVDGGESWQPVSLPLPPGFAAGQATLQGTPQFTGPENGVLPVAFAPEGTGAATLFADVTTDGGATWIQEALPTGAYALSVIDATDWVAVGGGISGPDFVEHSSDAGKTWSKAVPDRSITGLENVQFISQNVGLGVVSGGNCPASSAPQPPPCQPASVILKTVDGGTDWSTVELPPSAT